MTSILVNRAKTRKKGSIPPALKGSISEDDIIPVIQSANKNLKSAKLVFSEPINQEDDDTDDDSEDFLEDGDDDDDLGVLIPFFLGAHLASPQSEFHARILASDLPQAVKELVIKRLENSDLDKPKQKEWIESVLSIPFGKYATTPVSLSDSQETLRKFFDGVIKRFDEQVHGLHNVKQEILNYIGQFISAGHESSPRVLALWGSAGVGKTHVIRTALSDVLNRPMKCINLGGVKDSVFLIGFDYTYSSARYGMLVQALIDKKVMNPIILLEEVDKISESKEGMDLQDILMSLTDPETNTAFQDKYFAGIDIDFSKAIIVFTLNDPSLLHPILYNRLNLVRVPDPTVMDKIIIAEDHMIPKLCANIGIDPTMVKFTSIVLKYINTRYCADDKGLRTLKRNIESILLRLNMIKLTGIDFQGQLKLTFPVIINEKIADIILYREDEQRVYPSMYV